MKMKIGKIVTIKSFTLSELTTINTKETMDCEIQMIISISELMKNLDIFLKYADNVSEFCCKDYESALLLNKIMNDGKIKCHEIYLLDDQKQQNRSYIDTTIFKNGLYIPDTYVMWGVKYDNKVNVYTRIEKNTCYIFSPKIYDDKTIQEIKRITSMIAQFPENLTEVQKIIIVSNYIQMYNQFIEGIESHVGEEKYVLDFSQINDLFFRDSRDNIEKMKSDPQTVLFHHFGVCRTFTYATTLLLNNPILKINARSVYGHGHEWNTIELNGKLYHLDNSRAISRGKNRMNEALRATKFNPEFLLIGQDTLKKIGHEQIQDNILLYAPLSNEDFDRNYIDVAIEHLKDTDMISFEYGDEAFYPTHKV